MKFDLSAAWNDAMHLLRTNFALLVPIAGIFFFLPTLIFTLSVTEMAEPAANSSATQTLSLLLEYFQSLAPYFFLISIFAIAGNLTMLKLFLGGRDESVGSALKAALILFLPAIIAQFLGSIIMFFGFMLLIVPGLYLSGRLALMSAVIAGENEKNPINAISRSWNLTENNGWWVFLYILIIGLVGAIIQAIISGITGVILGFALSVDIAFTITSAIDAVLSAIVTTVTVCATASIYRQFTGPKQQDYNEVFD